MSVAQQPQYQQLLLPPAVSLPREHLAAIQHIINDALALQARSRRSAAPPPPYNTQRPDVQWFKPRMDMYESPAGAGGRPLVTAKFELPGLRKEDVHIEVLDNRMVVTGDRLHYAPPPKSVSAQEAMRDDDMDEGTKSEIEHVMPEGHPADEEERNAGYTVREIKRGRFRRVVPLPSGTKLEDVKASMHDGILTVTFPGVERPIAHHVPVA